MNIWLRILSISRVGKYYVVKKKMVFLTVALVNKPIKWIESKEYIYIYIKASIYCIPYSYFTVKIHRSNNS